MKFINEQPRVLPSSVRNTPGEDGGGNVSVPLSRIKADRLIRVTAVPDARISQRANELPLTNDNYDYCWAREGAVLRSTMPGKSPSEFIGVDSIEIECGRDGPGNSAAGWPVKRDAAEDVTVCVYLLTNKTGRGRGRGERAGGSKKQEEKRTGKINGDKNVDESGSDRISAKRYCGPLRSVYARKQDRRRAAAVLFPPPPPPSPSRR